MSHPDDQRFRPSDDVVSAMLRLSRQQELPNAPALERSRAQARDAWLDVLKSRRRRRMGLALGAIAASVLTAVGIVLVVRPSGSIESGPVADLEQILGDIEVDSLTWSDTGEKSISLGLGSVLETAAKGRASFRLSNGSRVRLDSATRVRLAGDRSLKLETGALYFDSAPNGVSGTEQAEPNEELSGKAKREVVVRTELATLKNRGTSYEVRVSPSELVVAVRSGTVLIDPRRGEDARVERGQILRLSSDGSVTIDALLPTDPRFDWTRPLIEPFDIDGRTVAEFLSWVECESGLEVRLGAGVDVDLLEVRLRGDLIWTSPEDALQPTLELVGAGARFESGRVIVER